VGISESKMLISNFLKLKLKKTWASLKAKCPSLQAAKISVQQVGKWGIVWQLCPILIYHISPKNIIF
jgi:hypothetical protein